MSGNMSGMASLHVHSTAAIGRHRIYDGRWLQLDRVKAAAGSVLPVRAPAGDECVVVLLNGEVTWNGVTARRS